MEQKEINRLKEICEKEGFDLSIVSFSDETGNKNTWFDIKKKDEWEGVEFAEIITDSNGFVTKGKIYIIYNIQGKYFNVTNDSGDKNGIVYKKYAKPSTEQAYKAQLIHEAKERFGEIKPGDKFLFNGQVICITGAYGLSFKYNKSIDALFFNAYAIYESGKWATKITKPEIKVEYTGWEYQPRFHNAVNIGFKVPNSFVMSVRLGELLAEFIKTHMENEKTC